MTVVHPFRGEKGEPLGEVAGDRGWIIVPAQVGGGRVAAQGGLDEGLALRHEGPSRQHHQQVAQDQTLPIPSSVGAGRGGRC